MNQSDKRRKILNSERRSAKDKKEMTGLHAYCGGVLTLLLALNIILYAEAGKVCTFIVILGFSSARL